MKAILTGLWAAVLFMTSLPSAAAQPEWDTRQVKIDYSDLDLTKAHGVSALQHRVSGAVRQVCDGPDFSLREKMQQRACAKQAGSSAVGDVDKAIAIAKQQSSDKPAGGAKTSDFGRSISTFKSQPWNKHEPIPQL